MRVLMMATPVSTHFAPLVPLAWAFRAAGHEVLVAGQPDILPMAHSAGLSAVSIADRFGVEKHMLNRLAEGKRSLESVPRPKPEEYGDFGLVWVGQTRYVLPMYLRFARGYRPDLIVSDPFEYSALMVGGVLGVPVVHHRWGVDALTETARAAVREPLRELCAEHGLDGLPDPTVLVDPCPPSLQVPGVERGLPMRCVPFNGGAVLPPWRHDEVGRIGTGAMPGTRRVVVSMGGRTLLLNGVPFLRRILRAFDGLPEVEVLATVEERYRAELGELPANTRLIDPTPLDLILESCAAVVHHGGAGTAMTATAFGLPQLVLPQMADQFGHGDRLAAVGAAIAFDTVAEQDDPGLLRDSMAALLSEPGHRKAATELRAEMQGMPTPGAVARELARLARPGAAETREAA
ncbi:L-noviosyl transferase [Micromonospora sp. MW-13]|uniref:SaqGT3 n=1 Tax=Micromonospora sp. Tu 6368 TaxID=428986 RepID=C4NYL0_9ACTN|nr:nucleotide disphospho-sugar-binding domain-containing protein [Micromonospora sp. MW-13]ACP19364.1 SaqGT3 [Micromonospora sp. Tu 6368]RGC65131.1 L-noviosyl transferase [Micromonospora sp. MW-13]